jgi:hypothetical protein
VKKMKNIKLFAVSKDLPSAAGSKRLGKKLYITIGVVVALVTIFLAFLIPQGQATIPLNVDYTVGEKMVYDSPMSMTIDTGRSSFGGSTGPKPINISSQQTIEVMSFDGENYLLNHTTTMNALGRPLSYSMTEKMNKTGYSTYLLDVGSIQQEIPSGGVTSNTFLAQMLSKPEVKVGETISVPFPNSNQYLQTTGDLTMTFSGVEDLTVPAGTYRVFRIDLSSSNLKISLNPSAIYSPAVSSDVSMNLNLNCQIYLEYGTLRQIKSSMQETGVYQSSIMNMTANTSMDMTLVQHIKP